MASLIASVADVQPNMVYFNIVFFNVVIAEQTSIIGLFLVIGLLRHGVYSKVSADG